MRETAEQREIAELRSASTVCPPRPAHYKVIALSLYVEDIALLDAKVAELRSRGFTKATKSWLVRRAIERLDLDTLTNGVGR